MVYIVISSHIKIIIQNSGYIFIFKFRIKLENTLKDLLLIRLTSSSIILIFSNLSHNTNFMNVCKSPGCVTLRSNKSKYTVAVATSSSAT